MDLVEVWSVSYARKVMHSKRLSSGWPTVAMAGTLIQSWVSTGMLERTALGNSLVYSNLSWAACENMKKELLFTDIPKDDNKKQFLRYLASSTNLRLTFSQPSGGSLARNLLMWGEVPRRPSLSCSGVEPRLPPIN